MMTFTKDAGGESGKAIAVHAPVIATAVAYSSHIRRERGTGVRRDNPRRAIQLRRIRVRINRDRCLRLRVRNDIARLYTKSPAAIHLKANFIQIDPFRCRIPFVPTKASPGEHNDVIKKSMPRAAAATYFAGENRVHQNDHSDGRVCTA
jgi:hypothetical protein